MWPIIVVIALKLSEAKNNKIINKEFNYKNEPSLNISHKLGPVPFTHLTREGFGEPGYLPPIDLLEMERVVVKDPEKVKKLLKSGKYVLERVVKEYDKENLDVLDQDVVKVKTENAPPYLDFARLQRRNLDPLKKRLVPGLLDMQPSYQLPTMSANIANIGGRANRTMPHRKSDQSKNDVMTTCDEFGREPDFDPKEVVDIEWVPFYVWSPTRHTKTVAHIHVISYPTKEIIQHYKEEFGSYLNRKVDWNSPKLLLREKTGTRREMLLLALDRKGLFYGIPYTEIPKNTKLPKIELPVLTARFKIVDPYLAIMFCDYPTYATIMAVSGNEPTERDKIISEAKALRFKGPGVPVFRNLEDEKLMEFLERQEQARRSKQSYNDDWIDTTF